MDNLLKSGLIEDADPFDSLSIRKLALDTNIDAWSVTDYSDEMARDDSVVLKATNDGDLEGFLVARVVPGTTEQPDAELYNIAVGEHHKRHGVGTRLISALLDRLNKRGVGNLWLEVRESNSEAALFYRRIGFRAELTRPNFYANPVDNAVIMRLQIGPKGDVLEGKTMLDSRVEEE